VVVAIDGPGGVGKSTVARRVAAILAMEYLDTGATYRAATVAVLRAGVDIEDAAAVLAAVQGIEISYEDGVIMIDGQSVAAETRSEPVTLAVSAVSAYPEVREDVVAMQRAWVAARGGRAVVEGRDIGTIVFPDAPVKVFLTADAATRARRRASDAEAADLDVAAVEADLARRDRADSTRKASPLRAAEDAVVIDTTDLGIDEVVAVVLELVAATRT